MISYLSRIHISLLCRDPEPASLLPSYQGLSALSLIHISSHAAVVARGRGTACVSGCGEISINEEAKVFELGGETIHEGDYISLDGSTGNIYLGDIKTVEMCIRDRYILTQFGESKSIQELTIQKGDSICVARKAGIDSKIPEAFMIICGIKL